MNINLKEIIPMYCYPKEIDELNCFSQFNIYETIDYKNDVYKSINNLYEYDFKVCKIENTSPNLNIISTKIINTMEGTSIDGQHLTGKKLIIIGELELSLVLTYYTTCNKYNKIIKEVRIPFSTFIIIPKDIYNLENINLRYLIEDISTAQLCNTKSIVSATLLIQYADEY